MNIKASERMKNFESGIFSRLKTAVEKRKLTDQSFIDLSLGTPDISPVEKVRAKLAEESLKETSYGYTLGGLSRFNEAVSNYYKRVNNVNVDAESEVLQTMGSQEGLVHLPLAFCNPGDIVITTNPAYLAYDAGIKLAGAESYELPLLKENDYLPQIKDIPESIAKKAKLLILNFPGNPVPATATKEFLTEVIAFAKKYNILILHDAAYSEFYYTNEPVINILTMPGAKDVCIETNSLSKSFSLAGARIAYFVGNKQAIQILKNLKSNLDYGVFSPIQEAAIVALDNAEEITEHVRRVFSERYDVMSTGLKELGWSVAPSTSGMFLWAEYPEAIADETFVFKLIEEKGIALVPGSAFGSEGKGYVRIALVQEKELLKKALKKLAN
ncbi:MAG TPA: aminotransferase class I/II-fold pyridoxal phosphate-dependent enzyme [Pseudogracilibacillus sp.]|nr:aminotransferase class I/II-fold pyridoxal phosphate-dependent enzyme [Pseudogracilibacillus sp.]